MDSKKLAAAYAVDLIEEESLIGLGAGSTVAFLAELMKYKIDKGFKASFVSSSQTTMLLMQKYGFKLQPVEYTTAIDIYFDGCDQVDDKLNALKSGGGIHTQEKLLASMAQSFVLMIDYKKFVPVFSIKFPLVVELLPQAILYVPNRIRRMPAVAKVMLRNSDSKDGPVVTINGNYLADVWFKSWPELDGIQAFCKSIPGIVETSLFYGMANKLIMAGDGVVKVMESAR